MIKYNKEVNFLGRNGYGRQTGIDLFNYGQFIALYPITSKGVEGRCTIEIPKEDIPAVIAMLQKYAETLVAAQVSDTTGGASSNTAD